MSGRNLFTIFAILALIGNCLLAQDSLSSAENPILSSNKVMMIGDDESLQSRLNIACADILLNIDGLNMSQAYTVWLSMLSDLESYADDRNFDINGLKLWMNVYWNEDGSIRQIIFYPKPNSRNIDFEKFSSFMNGFANDYSLQLNHTSCFSHFGSASFPTFYEQLLKKD